MLLKRTLIATIMGLLTGLVCAWGRSMMTDYGFWMLVSIVASRTVAGFAIGISRWKMPWWLHGPVLGAIFGLPISITAFGSGVSFLYGFIPTGAGANGFYILMAASIVYGFIVELVTSLIFRAKQR